MTCVKSQGFLAEHSVEVSETVDARKQKFEGKAAVSLVRQADEVWIAKGKAIRHLELKKESVSDAELLKLITGPTGNLRAPTIRRGRKLFIGFEPDQYAAFLK